MANAYATLAADGMYCAPTPVTDIIDPDGNKLDAAKPACHQVVDPNVAHAATDAARCPMGDQSAFGECDQGTAEVVHQTVKRPVAGKTGTTEGNRNAALVAMTKQLSIGAIMTDPDWQNNTEHMSHPKVNAAVAATLKEASAGKPVVNFTPPPKEIAFGKRASIPSVTCKSPDTATSILMDAGFQVTTDPDPVTSNCPAGTVARTDPSGQTSRNGLVSLVLSKGPGDAGPDPGQTDGPDPGNGPPPPPIGNPRPTPTKDPRCKKHPWLCPVL